MLSVKPDVGEAQELQLDIHSYLNPQASPRHVTQVIRDLSNNEDEKV
jgi:hypothetical protein